MDSSIKKPFIIKNKVIRSIHELLTKNYNSNA